MLGYHLAEDLIPGLPNCVTLQYILPKLPWHTRSRLLATSKAWKQALQKPHVYGELSRRAFHGLPWKGEVLLHQLPDRENLDCLKKLNTKAYVQRLHALSILEVSKLSHMDLRMHSTESIWRRLPPIPAFAPLKILHECCIACLDGKIFVMGGWHPCTNAISADTYMLDIAAGLWTWESLPPMNLPRAFFHCISGAGKIYVVGGISVSHSGPNPEVYNLNTRRWELLPKVVLSRTVHYNGASFIAGNDFVVTHGFCTTDTGDLVRFRRIYSPVTGEWSDYEPEGKVDDGDDVRGYAVAKYADVEGMVASKYEKGASETIAPVVPSEQVQVIARVMMK